MHEFSSILSDAHCPVSMTITVDLMLKPPKRETREKVKNPILWQTEKCETYTETFDILKDSEIESKLDGLIQTNNITDDNIIEIVNGINYL